MSETDTICLLNSAADARRCLADLQRLKGCRLVATHHAAVDELEHHGVACEDAASFVSVDDQRDIVARQYPGGDLHALVQEVLRQLDSCAPRDLRSVLGLARHLPLLSTMYGYFLANALAARSLCGLALRRMLDAFSPREVLLVTRDQAEPPFFSLEEMLAEACADRCGVRPWRGPQDQDGGEDPAPGAPEPHPRPARAGQGDARSLEAFLLLFAEDAWVTGPLLSAPGAPPFMILSDAGSLSAPQGQTFAARSAAPGLAEDICRAIRNLSVPGFPAAYWDRLAQGFARRAGDIFDALCTVDAAARAGSLLGGVWYYSTGVNPIKGLTTRYMLACGLPVLGLQHGGNFGIQRFGYPILRAEFDCCSHYLSHGFTRADLSEEVRGHVPCEIIPVGNVSPLGQNRPPFPATTRGRVLFPPTNCLSLAGQFRLSPAILAEAQRQILLQLSRRTDLEVWIKPFADASPKDFAWSRLLHGLGHVKIGTGSFPDALRDLRPDLVIVEFLSAPLFEAMFSDAHVLLLLDPLYPLTCEAERLLRERVIVVHSIDELLERIEAYPQAFPPRLGGTEFLRRYLLRPDARDAALREVRRILTGARRQTPPETQNTRS